MQYPTDETIADWDGPSLTAVLWERTFHRRTSEGSQGLNHIEQVIHVLMHFDNEFNNGGCGQWLDQCPGDELRVTPALLCEIGAVRMAQFVEEIYAAAGDAITEPDEELRQHNLVMLPCSFHSGIEDLSSRFFDLESEFLDLLYAFARRHWHEVRVT